MDEAISPLEQCESETPSMRLKLVEEKDSTSPYHLLDFQVDGKHVDNIVIDSDTTYDLSCFSYELLLDKYDDLSSASASFIADSSNEGICYIRVETTFRSDPRAEKNSFDQLHALLVCLGCPIPCNNHSKMITFCSRLFACRSFPGCDLHICSLTSVQLEVSNDWEGTSMAYDATFDFVLRKSKYLPAPRCTETLVFIPPEAFANALVPFSK